MGISGTNMSSGLLTTGQVAKICGVTPDAVLKWIKSGRLPAQRTPGGHYRVSRQACRDLGLAKPTVSLSHSDDVAESPKLPVPVRCWEYFGSHGRPQESCRNCIVFLARAQNCYKLARFGEEMGHRLNYCATDCGDCAFYRALRGLAATVLVVTRDEVLARELADQIDSQIVSLHFVKSGYDCSSAIGSLRPVLVVLDSDLPEVLEGHLVESVTDDDRIPNAIVFVACRAGDEAAVRAMNARTIAAPFTAQQLAQLVVSATRLAGRIPRDVA